MSDYGRRIVVDLGFEATVDELSRAIRAAGLQTLMRIDVRDHFGREQGHDFRHYVLIEAWSPDLMLDALRHNLDIGTILPSTFATYELGDGETAVVAKGPMAPVADEYGWRRDSPVLAGIADRETDRVARILDRLQNASSHKASAPPAA
jgi:uncharacterized protein (DUF302 family)